MVVFLSIYSCSIECATTRRWCYDYETSTSNFDRLKAHKLRVNFIATVHDEWQLECHPDDAVTVGKLGVQAIEEVGIDLVARFH